MTVVHLGDRLRVTRTPEQVEQHKREMAQQRRAAAWRLQTSKQRAKRLQRSAAWADATKIAAMYRLAARLTRRSGIPHEVDHIIPLQGANVCGLHVETNLQVITRKANRRKWNRFDGDEMVGDAGFEPATSSV